jgi:hypothetical protein
MQPFVLMVKEACLNQQAWQPNLSPTAAHLSLTTDPHANLGSFRLCRSHRLVLALTAAPQVHLRQRLRHARRGLQLDDARNVTPLDNAQRAVEGCAPRLAHDQPISRYIVGKDGALQCLAAGAWQLQLQLDVGTHGIAAHRPGALVEREHRAKGLDAKEFELDVGGLEGGWGAGGDCVAGQ